LERNAASAAVASTAVVLGRLSDMVWGHGGVFVVGHQGKEPAVVDEKKGKIPGQRVADEGVMYVGLASHALSDEPPKKTRDWKGIAALVTALVAAAGFVWNKAEGCYDRAHNQSIQAASYEATAGKIEDLYVRLGALEHVIQMLPPVLTVSDAMVLGPKIDGVILVVWGGKTAKDALKQAKEKLDLLKVRYLGVVINNLNIQEHDSYYMYHYHQYYGEGRGDTKSS